ncbi:MAG: DegT/DnrJ/EryC1/StrS family aminotransferase, partial [Verrucomicrobia bacterium]|nr:DegT/DnrJ/EryC1/StrS family aminotransferase [Verrucomicrobiota bacterium]
CGVHYPVPVHLQGAYRSLGHGPGAFPIAERCAEEFVSLPMFPELTPAQVNTVIEAVAASVSGSVPV